MQAAGFEMGGASNPAAADVGIADAGSLITATTVEGALQELAAMRKYIAAAGDQTATQQNTSLQDDTELVLSFATGQVWWLEGTFIYTAASGTPDVKWAWKVANGSLIHGVIGAAGSQGGFSINGTGATPGGLLTESGDAAAGSFTGGSMNGTWGFKAGGLLTTSGACTVTFKFCQSTSDASNLVRKAKSFLLATRLS